MTVYIQNEDNYGATLQNTEKECFVHYIKITNDYIRDFNEKIIYQNGSKHAFVIAKGLETIRHVYTQFLLYSNNLEFTVEVTEKAYQYFIEFIDQIGEETNAIFNLSSLDATLFAYKKTIYEIPQKTKKDFTDHDPLICHVKAYIDIYDALLFHHLNTHSAIEDLDVFLPVTDSLMQLPLLFDGLDGILAFVKFLHTQDLHEVKYFQTVNMFVKHSSKKTSVLHGLERRFLASQIDSVLDLAPNKIVKWFLS